MQLKGVALGPVAQDNPAGRATALAAGSGIITDQDLEKASGGTGLRYSFEIKEMAWPSGIGVDAHTGKLLENKAEGPGAA